MVPRPRTPIIALTADATPEMEARCLDAGMDGCLTKPIEPARLLQVLDQMAPPGGEQPEMPGVVSEGVSDISAHPKFQAAPPAVNHRVLEDLMSLGGGAFLDELVAEFTTDADGLIADLAAAVAARDAPSFRDRIHALRSAAGNIGARGVYEMCLAWRHIDDRELAEQGDRHVGALTAELARVQAALAAHALGTEPKAVAQMPVNRSRKAV
jgi:two-component system sensor histidine kinase RpfC